MTELTVKDINSNWSISFDFSTRKGISASYDFSSMTVGRLKREIYNANNLYAVEQQKLIFMGIILNHDDVELKNLISSDERACFHLLTSLDKKKTNSSSTDEKALASSIVVDAISLRSASEWLSKYSTYDNNTVKSDHFYHLQSIYEVLKEVKVANSPSVSNYHAVQREPPSPQIPNAAVLPGAAPALEERDLEPIVWINVSLMAKLVAVAAFFIYNKNLLHRMDQLLCIAVSMVFFYLAQIGAIYRAFYLICRYLKLVPLRANRAVPVPPHAGQQQQQQQHNQQPQQQQLQLQNRQGILTELLQHGVTIPTEKGFLNDLFSVIAGALCSLHPQWKPAAVTAALHPAAL